jgi:hypothetical protein
MPATLQKGADSSGDGVEIKFVTEPLGLISFCSEANGNKGTQFFALVYFFKLFV